MIEGDCEQRRFTRVQGERPAEQAAMAFAGALHGLCRQWKARGRRADTSRAYGTLFKNLENPSGHNAFKFADSDESSKQGVAVRIEDETDDPHASDLRFAMAQVRGIRTYVSASPTPTLTAADVQAVVQNAAQSVNATTLVIAVTDRQGNILGVFPAQRTRDC